MNAQLQLFFTNIDKIVLYFGADAKYFYIDLALKLTVRNIVFNYEDYEKVRQQIKNNTKWYNFARVNTQIINTYFVHYAKEPEKVGDALNLHKSLTKQFTRHDDSYIAAAYLKSEEHIERINLLMKDLMNKQSVKYAPLKLSTNAMLAGRAEDTKVLANSVEQYYQALVSIGFERTKDTTNTAVILTIGTGGFHHETFARLKELATYIKKTEITLTTHRYNTIALLSLAKFEVHQFPALHDMHEEICRFLKLDRMHFNSLLVATQIYTSTEAIGDLSSYDVGFSTIIFSAAEHSNTGRYDSDITAGGAD
ncbi:DUF4003 family protein [Solibacillus isronensis]|uniref:DUF4003 family protein n=1 Tax=Solibacillus isronensis TaxID=412383 RepID=UPI00203D5B42|nr:DUF4003 family protein [Solibacillus isronensis]MCM3722787.1 DUF4003 domain-containing protein [Solibacillus isronensis]